MSLPEPARLKGERSHARGALWRIALVGLVAAPLLAGCESGGGFQPLYGSAGIGAQAQDKLARIDIAPIPSRIGQRVRNELIFYTQGGGAPPPPAYRLDIVLKSSVTSTLVQKSGETLGQVYNLDANFQLVSLTEKKVILQGTSFGRAGFERYSAIYSNVRASQDAEDRAAKAVAADLRARLGAFLAERS
jgi:LPS-assembly lipoprotein